MKRAQLKQVMGTSKKGTLQANYEEMKEAFGEPHETTPSEDGKVRVEWAFETEDGTIITIYDWKEERPVEKVTEWNIGGKGDREKITKEIEEKFLNANFK